MGKDAEERIAPAAAPVRHKWRWLFAAVLVVGALALGEGLVRLFGRTGFATPDTLRANSIQFEPTVYARHAFPQMAQISADPGYFYINPRGYRGRDFEVPKPSGTIRVVIMGGSQVYDGSAREGYDWPHLVESNLHARGYWWVEVINAGIPGHASADTLGRIFSEIWMLEPDYIVVCHAWNDIKYFADLSPEHSLLRSVRPPPFRQQDGRTVVWNPYMYYSGPLDRWACRSQLYVRLRNRYWSWRLGRVGFEGLITGTVRNRSGQAALADDFGPWGPRQYELTTRLIARAAQCISAVPVLVTQPRLVRADNTAEERGRIRYEYVKLTHAALVRAFAECDQALRRAAAAEGAALLELAQLVPATLENFSDQVHTTAAGDQAIAAALAEFLADRVAARSQK